MLEIKKGVVVDENRVVAVVDSGADAVITLDLQASTKDITATDMDADDVLDKIKKSRGL